MTAEQRASIKAEKYSDGLYYIRRDGEFGSMYWAGNNSWTNKFLTAQQGGYGFILSFDAKKEIERLQKNDN